MVILRGGKSYCQGPKLREWIKKRDNYTCQLCGAPGEQIDHIKPFAEGGLSVPNNLRVLCLRCNLLTRRQRKDACLPLGEYYKKLEAELHNATVD